MISAQESLALSIRLPETVKAIEVNTLYRMPNYPAHQENPRVFRLGISGGIACGKSTVAHSLLRGLRQNSIEAYYLDVDSLRKQILEDISIAPFRIVQEQLIKIFGYQIARATGGGIDRRILSDIVFAESEALALFEAVVDPVIYKECANYLDSGTGVLLLESALLIEKLLVPLVDYNVLLVECSMAEQLRRLSDGDLPQWQLTKRMKLQGSEAERRDKLLSLQRAASIGTTFTLSTERGLVDEHILEIVRNIGAALLPKGGSFYG